MRHRATQVATQDRTARDPARGFRGRGYLGCRPSRNTRATDATNTSIRCHTTIALTRLSLRRLRAATLTMRVIRPIRRVAIIAPSNDSHRRNGPSRSTITGLVSASPKLTKRRASRLVYLHQGLGTLCRHYRAAKRTVKHKCNQQYRVRTCQRGFGDRWPRRKPLRNAKVGSLVDSARTVRPDCCCPVAILV